MPHRAHVHAAENDRGSPGSGHVDWAGLREALLQGGYGGWVVAETFTGTIPGDRARATAIWRPVVLDLLDLTPGRRQAFLRHLFPPAPSGARRAGGRKAATARGPEHGARHIRTVILSSGVGGAARRARLGCLDLGDDGHDGGRLRQRAGRRRGR